MTAAEQEINTLFIPEDIVVSSAGFAIDIGGSLAKIVFRSKKDYHHGKFIGVKDPECTPGMGPLKSIQFPRAEADTYCAFLKENCDIIQGGTVYGTGLGGSQYLDKIKALGVKLQMLTEFECFSRSLNILLARCIKEEWLHPLNIRGVEEGVEYLRFIKIIHDMSAGRTLMTEEKFNETYLTQVESYVKRFEEEKKHLAGVQYPYLMVMCGSAFAYVKVFKDGTAETIDCNMISGRFFLGMSCILSGEKDYSKLIKMCEDYDGSSVDIKSADLIPAYPKQQEDVYSKFPPDCRVFPFGKGHDIEEGSAEKGDLVSSLNQTICENLALGVFQICQGHKIRQAYFCGGFVSQEVVRRYITKGMTHRNLLVPSESRVAIDFVANSSHLGTIGAFVSAFKAENV